jgi:hypothetical protein
VSLPRPFNADELGGGLSGEERRALNALGTRLIRERPAPRAAFRAELTARLRGERRAGTPRPAWLWQRVAALTLAGGGLLGLVALGVARVGPFGP